MYGDHLVYVFRDRYFFPAEQFLNIRERFLLFSFMLVSSQDLNA